MSSLSIIKKLYRSLKYTKLSLQCNYLCKRNKEGSLTEYFSDSQNSILFVSHNLGGGTAQYEKNFSAEHPENIYFVKIISYGKNLCFKLESKNNPLKVYLPAEQVSSVFHYEFKSVVINSLLQIYNPFKMMEMLETYKSKYEKTKFIYHIHDFHCVCPIVNLIANNWDCDLKCSEHKCKFDLFVNRYTGSIDDWRKQWYKLLNITDEIICFSENSRNIILKAYSKLDNNKVIVKPHSMSYCHYGKIEGVEQLPLHIGIIGAVFTVPKGKLVIQELLRRIPSDIPVTFIGATKKQMGISRKNTEFYGKYKYDELPELIKKSTISMGIFPSIWSETFSYLVSEHIMMGLPIMCFDIGAQADKVRAYDKGIVVKDVDEMVEKIEKLR